MGNLCTKRGNKTPIQTNVSNYNSQMGNKLNAEFYKSG